MAEADELCDLLFLWLEKRKKCAEKLLALAKELENVHEISTVSQVVGSVIALSTAGVVTFLTGGLATPLLVAIAGAAVDVASTAIEAVISGNTMKEAKSIIQDDEKIGKNIQEAIEKLEKKCGVQLNGAHGSTDVDREVTTQIMWAVARRNNVDVPLDFLRIFVRSTFNQNVGGLPPSAAAIPQMLILSAAALCFQLGIESFAAGAKGLGMSAASAGGKAAAKAGCKVF